MYGQRQTAIDGEVAFADRTEAGRELGAAVAARLRPDEDAVVLGLARGGVVVAAEVARLTGKPLDVVVVRKIGAPENEELAIGAIGEEGEPILNDAAIGEFAIFDEYVSMAVRRAREEMQRRVAAYRQGPRPAVAGKTAVLVDDGVATGATIEAAIETVKRWGAGRVVVAVPVISRQAEARLRRRVDDLVVLHVPRLFLAVGQFYDEFPQVTDDQVRALLAEGREMAA
jgi:putative phosphoribosyl transferase